VATCTQQQIPVLGVCRGAQHLVTYYGGTLRPVEGHVARPHGIALHPSHSSRSSSVGELSRMPLTARDAVNSFHNWGAATADLPPVLRPVALAPDDTVEAFVHRSLPHWGIFWHPERDPHDVRDADILRALFA
jgi:putative glutamine amidotransferase